MSSDEYSNQYKILEKILNGTIELYNKYELENILKNGKRWPKDRKIIDFIIAQNKIGNASRRTDIIDNLLIGRSTLDVYTRHLREKKLLLLLLL